MVRVCAKWEWVWVLAKWEWVWVLAKSIYGSCFCCIELSYNTISPFSRSSSVVVKLRLIKLFVQVFSMKMIDWYQFNLNGLLIKLVSTSRDLLRILFSCWFNSKLDYTIFTRNVVNKIVKWNRNQCILGKQKQFWYTTQCCINTWLHLR